MSKQIKLLLFLGFIPFLALYFFTTPSYDDFAYANSVSTHGLWGMQKTAFTSINGRYFASLMMGLNPVVWKMISFYPFWGLLTLVLCYSGLHYFLKTFQSEAPRTVSLFFLLLWICSMPNPVESLYWMAGYLNYTLPLFFYTLCWGAIFRCIKKQKYEIKHTLFPLITSFCLIGSNETIMLIHLFTFLPVGYYLWINKIEERKRALTFISIIFTGSLACFFLVVLCPGTHGRMDTHPKSKRFFWSLSNGLLYSIIYSLRYLSIPLIVSIIVARKWWTKGLREKFLIFNLPQWTIILLIVNFLCFFPALYGLGGKPPDRVNNLNMFFAIPLSFICIQFLLDRFSLTTRKMSHKNSLWLLAFSLLLSWNYLLSLYQLVFQAPIYKKQWDSRISKLKRSQGKPVVFKPLLVEPTLINYASLKSDKTHHINQDFATYFGVKSVEVEKSPSNTLR